MAETLEELFGVTKKEDTRKKLPDSDLKKLRAFAKTDERIAILLTEYENGDIPASSLNELVDIIKERKDRGNNAKEAKAKAQEYNDLLQNILDKKKYGSATGLIGAIVDTPLLGGIARKGSSIFDTDGQTIGGDLADLQRIKGQEFQKAFETLKGGGAVSNVEGATMLQAFVNLFDENGNLRKDMSEEEFVTELKRLQTLNNENLKGFEESYTFDPESGEILTAGEYADLYGKASPDETTKANPDERADGSLTTGQTESSMIDFTGMALEEMKAQYDTLPSGTVYMINGKKKRKK